MDGGQSNKQKSSRDTFFLWGSGVRVGPEALFHLEEIELQ